MIVKTLDKVCMKGLVYFGDLAQNPYKLLQSSIESSFYNGVYTFWTMSWIFFHKVLGKSLKNVILEHSLQDPFTTCKYSIDSMIIFFKYSKSSKVTVREL